MKVLELFSIVRINKHMLPVNDTKNVLLEVTPVTYEAFFSYTIGGEIKYGLYVSTKNLEFLKDNPDMVFNNPIYPVIDFSIILNRYVDINKDTNNTIRLGNGGILMSDDITYFYCYKAEEITNTTVIFNYGDKRNPDLEEISVVRNKPLIATYGMSGLFEISKVKDHIDILYSSVSNNKMLL